MEGKLSVLLHLVGCRNPASRCSVTRVSAPLLSPDPAGSTRGPRPRLPLFAEGSGRRARPTLSPFRPRRPQAPPRRTSSPHGDTPRFQWAPGSRTPRSCVSPFPRCKEVAEPEGPRDPRQRTKGAGTAPAAGHAHRQPRGRAPRPSPRLRAARNGGRATKWQLAGRVGGGVETPVAGHSPVPAVPFPEFGGRPCEDKWSGLAGNPRERSYGRRGTGSPGPPSPPRRMPSPRLHFANVPVVPRPPAPSLAPAGRACRAGRVQLGASPCVLPGGECGLGPWLCTLEFSAVPSQEKKRKVAAPSPSFPLCPSFQKLLRATQQKGTGSVALPPSPPF